MRGHSFSRNNPNSRHSSGFTLVELIISIVLIGMLAAVGSSMIVDSFTTTRMVNAGTASAGQARYALERLAREIREVKYASSTPPPTNYCSGTITDQYCITTMTATSVVFINGAGNTVTINNGGAKLTLQYSSPAATSTLASQVDRFALSYLDASGNATPSPSLIRFVEITLTVTDLTSGQSTAQRTRVALRNI